MRSAIRGVLFAVVGATLLHGSGSAQNVGKVASIAGITGDSLSETNRAELWSTGVTLRSNVRQNAPLLARDLVRLRERITVGLDLEKPGNGREQPSRVARVYLGSHKRSPVGDYEILPGTTSSLNALQVVIRQGLMVVEHARGGLLVVAEGIITTMVISTTVLFEVDSLTKTGTVFLKEGHISFPEYKIDVVGENLAWHIASGKPPQKIPATSSELKPLRHEVDYATRSVWQKASFWQKPGFLVPAAAVAAGGVVCIVAGCFGPPPPCSSCIAPRGTSRGGIDVTIP